MRERKGHGLLLEPIIVGKDYVLGGHGSLGGEVLAADGQWTSWLPNEEDQSTPTYETNACTSFGTESAIQIIMKRQYDRVWDGSESFSATGSGTDPKRGNTPQKVAEFWRKSGAVPIEARGFGKSLAEFYSPIPQNLYTLASSFLAEFDFTHQYVPATPRAMMDELRYSPLGVSVAFWNQKGDVWSKPKGTQDNHWACLVGYKEGEYWLIFDSYFPYLKKYAWDSQFDVVKSYRITRHVESESAWSVFLKWLRTIVYGEPAPATITIDHTSPAPAPKYRWDTKDHARHSVRVICDEEKLTLEQKNTLCATVGAESGWQSYYLSGPKKGQPVKLENKKNGKVWSTDWGIAQINDHYHIGPGKSFPSSEYVLNNPDAVIRWMCNQWKAGNRHLWVAYSNGSYKKFL